MQIDTFDVISDCDEESKKCVSSEETYRKLTAAAAAAGVVWDLCERKQIMFDLLG